MQAQNDSLKQGSLIEPGCSSRVHEGPRDRSRINSTFLTFVTFLTKWEKALPGPALLRCQPEVTTSRI